MNWPSAAGITTARRDGTEASGQAVDTSAKANRSTSHGRETRSSPGESGVGLQRPTASRSAVDTLAVSAMIMLAVTVIQRGVGFSRGILFCRWLDPAALGQWELAFSFLLLAAPLSVLGLPGSFGRYVAYYQKRGQLRMFLRRTAIWTFLLGLLAVATVMLAAPHVSWLVFGDAGRGPLVLVMALSLGAVILHHFLESLLASLRMFRAVSMIQFCQSLGFATIALSLILLWRADAWSIVVAYGSACLLAFVAGALSIRSALHSVHDTAPASAAASFWRKLLRFSIWVWIVNLLANLFVVVDRYMIIHYSGLTSSQAIAEVGQYHSSRIVPVLLVSIAELIGSMIMPYLSHDWEDGRHRRVSRRLNLAVKLVALGMLVASWIILLGAPLLFGVAFAGKYA
ncbi:MAG: oligosaccharide flippase family protein, partial [Pirellulales bacterium]